MSSVAPETFARLVPGIVTSPLQQFTNMADPRFTPLATGLRRAAVLGAAAPPLAMRRCRCRRRTGLGAARRRHAESEARASPDRQTLEANYRSFRGSARRGHPPRGFASDSGLSESCRPHVPGGDRHDAACGADGAADRASALADRSCLAPRRRASLARMRPRRLLKPRPHDDRFPPRARHHSKRMDANDAPPLPPGTNRSYHRSLTVEQVGYGHRSSDDCHVLGCRRIGCRIRAVR